MQPRRWFIIFFITANLVGIMGCSQGNESEKNGVVLPFTQQAPTASNSTVAGACGNPLFPVRQGASWAYINSGGPNGDFAFSDTISEVHADGFTLTTQFTGLTRTQEWSCESDGLKALELGGGAIASISAQGMAAEFTTTAISGVSLPGQIVSGMQWQYNLTMQGTIPMPTGEQVQSNGAYSATMQEMGTETITVPAGTFEAVKFQSTSTVDILVPFGDLQVPMKYTGASLIWYAPGVGYIKSVENWDFGGTPYTSTTELQSYVIP
ncbi:MAG: hypothetical protein HZB18_17010 [Chloroflexi bacterium]|nr:hypothetical protein [Chloroflexota bacterium]